MNIDNFRIGSRTFIIAEIGNNHLGKISLAEETLQAAASCGVDAVKFQLFKPDLLVSPEALVLRHVAGNTHTTQRQRFRSVMLAEGAFKRLSKLAKELGVICLATPFDLESARFLDDLVPAYKIASGDANNYPLIEYIISRNKPILISTGMCNQREIDSLVKSIPRRRSILLHCIGAYPVPESQACLSLIPFLRKRYKMAVGYSDHTRGILSSLAAVTLGAVVIEKHFMLDKSVNGGDKDLSLIPSEMAELVNKVRELEKMMGDTPRRIQECETYYRKNLRRSAYAKTDIKAGQLINVRDIAWLRPQVGAGFTFGDLIGGKKLKARKAILAEKPLTRDNIIKCR
ncbi:MAG: N-acetylneuraminate synthase [Candidatus Omnitrophica bacterium]|nr:N-acetylneuraminate synthase [Candidatus Omnitrophota bacterium]